MNCKVFQAEMPELLLNRDAMGAAARAGLEAHRGSCVSCAAELAELERTFALLDAWQAPEPSPYFDQKMAVLLREEQAKPAAGWLERLRERLLFNTGRQFRPAMAAALAAVLVVGGGSYAGFATYGGHHSEVEASATVNDLQILDKNEQAIQQMDQLLQDDNSSDSGSTDQPAS